MAGAVGKGQQSLPVQGRAPSEKLLEWALGPGSKLGQIWDFLWNFPLPPFSNPPKGLPALTSRQPSVDRTLGTVGEAPF